MTYRYQGIEADTAEEIIVLKRALGSVEGDDGEKREKRWLFWDGGECPVKPMRRVEVRVREGGFIEDKAEYLRWEHTGEGDIIAYRVMD